MERRKFLGMASAGILGFSTFKKLGGSIKNSLFGETPRGPVPKRDLGRTGEKLSILGFGGLVVAKEDQETADAIVREAVDRGINYFDVAPSYADAEDRLGPALEPFRKNVFLACKTLMRDKKAAEEELHRSLQKMRTDHFDLYQVHALTKKEDLEQALGPEGAIETFLKAREDGKIRFIGFSAHSSEVALEAMKRFDFDTILFPVNFTCFLKANFGPEVIQKAREKKMGILALKALARQSWPNEEGRKNWPKCWYEPVTNPGEAQLAFRFTLSQPVTAAVSPGDIRLFKIGLDLAQRFSPLKEQEEKELRSLAATLKPIFELHPE